MNQQAMSKSWRDRNECAKSPNATVSDLEILSRDDSGIIRSRVAVHPKTPVFVLERLAGDRGESVLLSVIQNPNVTPEILKSLSCSPHHWVRINVASNINTPPDALECMVDDLPRVLYYLLRNPNTPHRAKNYINAKIYVISTPIAA